MPHSRRISNLSAATRPPAIPGPALSHAAAQLDIEKKREAKGMCIFHSVDKETV